MKLYTFLLLVLMLSSFLTMFAISWNNIYTSTTRAGFSALNPRQYYWNVSGYHYIFYVEQIDNTHAKIMCYNIENGTTVYQTFTQNGADKGVKAYFLSYDPETNPETDLRIIIFSVQSSYYSSSYTYIYCYAGRYSVVNNTVTEIYDLTLTVGFASTGTKLYYSQDFGVGTRTEIFVAVQYTGSVPSIFIFISNLELGSIILNSLDPILMVGAGIKYTADASEAIVVTSTKTYLFHKLWGSSPVLDSWYASSLDIVQRGITITRGTVDTFVSENPALAYTSGNVANVIRYMKSKAAGGSEADDLFVWRSGGTITKVEESPVYYLTTTCLPCPDYGQHIWFTAATSTLFWMQSTPTGWTMTIIDVTPTPTSQSFVRSGYCYVQVGSVTVKIYATTTALEPPEYEPPLPPPGPGEAPNYGGTTYITQVVTPLIIILIPALLLSFSFGIPGFMGGAVLGVIAGVIGGILPGWAVLIVGLTLIYLITRGEGNGGGGVNEGG